MRPWSVQDRTLRDPYVAQFVDNLIRYTDRATADNWITRLLHVDKGREILAFIEYFDFPGGGFTSKNRFDRWWSAHANDLEVLIELD